MARTTANAANTNSASDRCTAPAFDAEAFLLQVLGRPARRKRDQVAHKGDHVLVFDHIFSCGQVLARIAAVIGGKDLDAVTVQTPVVIGPGRPYFGHRLTTGEEGADDTGVGADVADHDGRTGRRSEAENIGIPAMLRAPGSPLAPPDGPAGPVGVLLAVAPPACPGPDEL